MPRPVLTIILVGVALAVVLVAATAGILSSTGAFRPGDLLFAPQYASESASVRLAFTPQSRANRALDLLKRRIADVRLLAGTEDEVIAVAYLNADLDRAARAADESNMVQDPRLAEIIIDLRVAVDSLVVIPRSFPSYSPRCKIKLPRSRWLQKLFRWRPPERNG